MMKGEITVAGPPPTTAGELTIERDGRETIIVRVAEGESLRSIAKRAADSLNARRFFICDDFGDYTWTGVARDRGDFIAMLRDLGAAWEVEIDGRYGPDQGIDVVLEIGLVEVRELTAEELAKRQRCHTEDERGVIPLAEAVLGDLFCSQW